MLTILIIALGKLIHFASNLLNIGSGSTWPGHIALGLDKYFVKKNLQNNKNLKVILIAGTNGKTTTGKMIKTILEENSLRVFQNEEGANLLNGIVSSFIKYSSMFGKLNYDYAILEVDENTLPQALKYISPKVVILLNLFRDQLDRYGEVNIIALKWSKTLKNIRSDATLILNADDPKIAYLGNGMKTEVRYFGLTNSKLSSTEHASDSTYCSRCNHKLTYKSTVYSHFGNWLCGNCGLTRPKPDIETYEYYPLSGLYNKYNVNCAVLTTRILGITDTEIKAALKKFRPAFGRQENIQYKNRQIKIFLSKNPASFNQSLLTINDFKAKNILIILNDRIPDGQDVSWIWDIDFENYLRNFQNISVSGDRAYDMALRIRYAIKKPEKQFFEKIKIYENLNKAINESLKQSNDILYILPTYSGMLEIRKILTGKAIL